MAGYIGSKSSVTLVDGYTEAEADAEFVTKTGDTMSGNLSLADNDKAIFGAGSDLSIYHDGSNSFIEDTGTGSLITRANRTRIQSDGGENQIECIANGTVELYYDTAKKIETTATGIAVTGSTAHTAGDITNTISGTYNLNGANGTAGSPTYVTYSFKDDVNTGMYRGGADTLSFATGGSSRMNIDASGRVTMPYQPYFYVRATAGTALGVSDYTTVIINNEINDVGGNFSGNVFTAPVTGVYSLSFNTRLNSLKNNAAYYNFVINTSNNTFSQLLSTGGFDQNVNYWVFTMNVIADMDAGDTSSCSINQQGGSSGTTIDGSTAFFGYLLG